MAAVDGRPNWEEEEAAAALIEQENDVQNHQPSWEPSPPPTPPQDSWDSEADEEGQPWTRDKYLMARAHALTGAELRAALARHGWGPIAGKGCKEPLKRSEPEPDLAEYFNDFNYGSLDRIRVCRAYATYLAAMQPKPEPKKKKSKK